MNQAGRLGMMRNGAKWVNPYVTDGLVAMWDGEWNAGPGVHTSERILTNLVSGEVIAIPNVGHSLGDNFIVSEANNTLKLGNLDGKISDVGSISSVGCCLTKPTDDTSTSGSLYINGFGRLAMWRRPLLDGACGIVIGSVCQQDGRIHYYGAPQDLITARAEADAEVFGILRSRAAVIQRQSSANNVAFYVDGQLKNGVNTMNYTDSWSNPNFDVKSPSATSCKVKWCNIAIYNRLLTADEIAANYAVDKARFNLP